MPRIALVSDIHGNLEAFEAVLNHIAVADPDLTLCLGDVVGYGPDPGACFDLAEQACDAIVVGNHDEALINPRAAGAFNNAASESLAYSARVLTRDQMRRIEEWPRKLNLDGLAITHGSFGRFQYEYITNAPIAAESMLAMDARVGAVGHTHVPSAFVGPAQGEVNAEDVYCVRMPERIALTLSESQRFIINPGSVGQPRDGDPNAAWGMLDTELLTFEVQRVEYDVDLTTKKIRAAGLPDFLGERLRVGA